MKFKILFVSPTSITLELINHDIYYAKQAYDVFLNDQCVASQVKRNVVSLYDLSPNQTYIVRIGDEKVEVKTKNVSVIFHARDFGVVGDGKKDDTIAINQAIQMMPKHALLQFEEGTYRVTSIFLKSDIFIEWKKGATFLAMEDVEAYPVFKGEIENFDRKDCTQIGQWEGSPFPMKASILSGYWLENVQLYGQGTIDGNAQNSTWWQDPKNLPWGRPRLLFLNGCQQINVQGLTFQNTPCWTLHPFYSKHLGFYDLVISNPKDSPNTDGMDPESCEDVDIIGIVFSVGDDCIAIKSGKMYMGMKYQTPSKDFRIRNCLMQFGHGGIVLGSEMSGGIQQLTCERCIFKETDRGLRIKTRRGRGKYAVIDGVEFHDILMDNVLTPLVVNMFYFCDPDGKTEYVWSKEKLPVDERTPYMGKFTFRHIHAINVEWAAGYFYGLPEQPIGEITIEDSSFEYKSNASSGKPAMMSFAEDVCKQGFIFRNVEQVKLRGVTLIGQDGERILLDHVTKFDEE